MTLGDLQYTLLAEAETGDGATAAFTMMTAGPASAVSCVPPSTPLLLPVQVHSDIIIEAESADEEPREADAIISRLPGVAVGVRTADCIPVLVNAPDIGAVAAIHAGWKGTIAGIVAKTIGRLCEMGADPSRCHAFIGPGICADCYEVSHELAARFIDAGYRDCILTLPGRRPHLDLKGINRLQLLGAGLPSSQIRVSSCCTLHTETPTGHPFPSYRRDTTRSRLVSLIKPE